MANVILSNPDNLNRILETWFIQNVLFDGAPYCLDLNGAQISNPQIIYMEIGDFDLDLISQINHWKLTQIQYNMYEPCEPNHTRGIICNIKPSAIYKIIIFLISK
jgi:hypothetical protein